MGNICPFSPAEVANCPTGQARSASQLLTRWLWTSIHASSISALLVGLLFMPPCTRQSTIWGKTSWAQLSHYHAVQSQASSLPSLTLGLLIGTMVDSITDQLCRSPQTLCWNVDFKTSNQIKWVKKFEEVFLFKFYICTNKARYIFLIK